MTRPVTLCTGQRADLPVAELARKCNKMGFDGLELACWGDHFEVDKAMAQSDYCAKKRELLEKNNMKVFAISAHLVGQAVCDIIDIRHKAILPDYVWGNGNPAEVNARAIEEMKNSARATCCGRASIRSSSFASSATAFITFNRRRGSVSNVPTLWSLVAWHVQDGLVLCIHLCI